MNILVTGCSGFIGFHLCNKLLSNKKNKIYGIDNLNSYYDIKLKRDRLKILKNKKNFFFKKIDIKINNKVEEYFKKNEFECVIHLAAQAGVRFSIKNPRTYLLNNVNGFFNILESCRKHKIKHFITASTSSVYGNNENFPLKEDYDTDKPLSFYAASKKSNEVMAYSFSNIYKLPITVLRFFTVYGDYGRPDMSLFKFTKKIISKKELNLFNFGNHERDFTHVDDVIAVIVKIINNPAKNKIPYQIYNVASGKPKKLKYFLNLIEKNLNLKANTKMLGLQKGDIVKTHASTTKINNKTNIFNRKPFEVGIQSFIKWYKSYYK